MYTGSCWTVNGKLRCENWIANGMSPLGLYTANWDGLDCAQQFRTLR